MRRFPSVSVPNEVAMKSKSCRERKNKRQGDDGEAGWYEMARQENERNQSEDDKNWQELKQEKESQNTILITTSCPFLDASPIFEIKKRV